MHRRTFIGMAVAAAGRGLRAGLPPGSSARLQTVLGQDPPRGPAATDEAFWLEVRALYVPPDDHLDLDQANIGRTAETVFEAFVERARHLSRAPAERFPKMWVDELDVRSGPALASLLGTERRKLAFVDSATVGLNTVLHGFPLDSGDEILVTDHEYPDMVETILNRCKRYGTVMRVVPVPGGNEDPGTLAKRVADRMTDRTKLVLISQVSAWSGEVLPVEEVTRVARARGAAVLVDAAQSIGVLDVNFEALGCDFLAGSLHKWLGAPIASGVLVMRPEHVGNVTPLHPPSWDTTDVPMDIYEWSGTFNMAARATVVDAIDFHRRLGAQRKRDRLRYLGEYWMDRLADEPRVRILTPRQRTRCFGMASFMVEGIRSKALVKHLRSEHGLLVQDKSGRHSPYENAIRVSPAPYTTPDELERFVAAVRAVARKGLPAEERKK